MLKKGVCVMGLSDYQLENKFYFIHWPTIVSNLWGHIYVQKSVVNFVNNFLPRQQHIMSSNMQSV